MEWGGGAYIVGLTLAVNLGLVGSVAVGLAAAGMFEFNFGDTEVFWIMLDIYALVIAFTERPLRSNEPAAAVVGVGGP